MITSAHSYLRALCGLFAALALGFLCTDAHAQQIFVVNNGAGTIGEFNLDGTTVNAALITGLSSPTDLAVSGSDLFVVEETQGGSFIGVYTTSGTTVNAALITGLSSPCSIAVSGSNLFVGGGGAISEYTIWGTVINANLIRFNDFGEPVNGIAVSGSELFFTPAGAQVLEAYTIADGTGTASPAWCNQSLNNPTSIVVSGTNLYVLAVGSGTVGQFTTSGTLVNGSLISGLSGDSQAVAMSGSNLYITGNWSSSEFGDTGEENTVGEYTTSGTTVNRELIGIPGDPLKTTFPLNGPSGIVVTDAIPESSTDTPAMPLWALASLAVVLVMFGLRFLTNARPI